MATGVRLVSLVGFVVIPNLQVSAFLLYVAVVAELSPARMPETVTWRRF